MNITSTNISILETRWETLPRELREVFTDDALITNLEEVATHYKLSSVQTDGLKSEVYFVLFLLESVTNLEKNIENLGIPKEQAQAITSELEIGVLFDVMDILKALRVSNATSTTQGVKEMGVLPEADKNLKERLSLRPQGVPLQPSEGAPGAGPKPLTREEVMQTLAPHRTMASDIESLRQKKEGGPVVGYGALRNTTEPTPSQKSE